MNYKIYMMVGTEEVIDEIIKEQKPHEQVEVDTVVFHENLLGDVEAIMQELGRKISSVQSAKSQMSEDEWLSS